MSAPLNVFPDRLRFDDAGMRGDSRIFELQAPFRYISSHGTITVPAGFITDGASIPRAFWSILHPFGPYFKAAVIHDFLYSPENRIFTRPLADEIFLEAMYNSGLDWLTRGTIFRAVRWFGGRNFQGFKP